MMKNDSGESGSSASHQKLGSFESKTARLVCSLKSSAALLLRYQASNTMLSQNDLSLVWKPNHQQI